MLVKDVMTKKVEWVGPDISLDQIAKKMRDANIGCVPVSENGRVIGMITDRDIACRAVAAGKDLGAVKARDAMSKGVTVIKETADVSEAATLMQTKGVRRLPVLNGENQMVGMISFADLAARSPTGAAEAILKAISHGAR
jgi:CBS domain-containing protein